jgi:hypothetical protein
MRDTNFLDKALSFLLGLVNTIFAIAAWVLTSIGKIIRRIVTDILKNIYARIIALVVTLLLIGLGVSSLAHISSGV